MRKLTLDAKKAFKPSRSAEMEFSRALKKVARASGHIVEAHVEGTQIRNEIEMQKALKAYSELIEPWGMKQSLKLLNQVSKTTRRGMLRKSNAIGLALKMNLAERQLDAVAAALMREQVALIKSIPIEAGLRAQKLSMEAILTGGRAEEIAQELMRTTEVTESRATLIARTETARANASLTEARALAVGSQAYVWRCTLDGAERDSHRRMNGKLVLYSRAPILSDGTRGHAGTFPNCRCWQDVQIIDD